MPAKPMTVYRYVCEACTCSFKAHELDGPEYGVMTARSTGRGTQVLVDAYADETFQAIEPLVDLALRSLQVTVNDATKGKLGQRAFGVTCDPDEDGSPFVIGAKPRCPECNSPRMASYHSTGQLETVELPEPTHRAWLQAPAEAQTVMIREAVSEALLGEDH